MKTINMILLLLLLFFSCKTVINSNDKLENNEKQLKTLVKKTVNDKKFIGFDELNLTFQKKGDSIKIYKNNMFIIKISQKYSKLYQIFNNKFLIISISKNNSQAGIDNFQRDSTYIVDLNKDIKGFISLKNTILEFDKKTVANYYSNNELNIIKHLAIDSINISNRELFLVQPNLEVKKYLLTKVD